MADPTSQRWKTVRVFISSTFRDMQAERDWLVKRVFPALRQRLEPYRIHLVDIDLRWGITLEQADNDQVLDLCLQQIDECRPFFLGLLGERYGWVPSRFPVEVGKRYGWTQYHTDKSMTELEILHGVLNDPSMHGRALFCFRSERFLDEVKDTQQRRIYVEGPSEYEIREFRREGADHRAANRCRQLALLKNQIRALSPPMLLFDGYPCAWDTAAVDPTTKQAGRIGGLIEFGNWVIEKVERAILDAAELQDHIALVRTEARDELAEERDFHARFIENRIRVYIGRQKLQDELKAFITGMEAEPCLVIGPSGSGKSAALAKFVSIWSEQHQQDIVVNHFVGASPRSTGLREMLHHLCAELKDALRLEDEIKQDNRGLSDQLRELVEKAPSDRRIVLVIDALNQLDVTDNTHSLYWLPKKIPANVRLIVSCIDDPDSAAHPALTAMQKRRAREIKVGLLNDEERLGILREIPSVVAKTLDEGQVRMLLGNKATRNPLFLLIVLEELRGFGSFEQLNQKIAGLPKRGDTLTAIFKQVIRRLREDFNAATVFDVLTLLACARYGISERELLDLIEGQSTRIEESRGDLFPILRQLRPFLQVRGSLLDFFHRHLSKATHEEFFASEVSVQVAAHQRLAVYFHGKENFLEPIEQQRIRARRPPPTPRPANRRKNEELVYQRIKILCAARMATPEFAQACEALENLLTDLHFLEAKTEAGLVFELSFEFSEAVSALPEGRPMRQILRLLQEAFRRDIHFIARHPTTLFQCMWNTCWWYDCPDAVRHYEEPDDGRHEGGLPWEQRKFKLHQLLEKWRKQKEDRTPNFVWLHSLRPDPRPLDTAGYTVLKGHTCPVLSVVFSKNDSFVISGSAYLRAEPEYRSGLPTNYYNGNVIARKPPPHPYSLIDNSIRVWDAITGELVRCIEMVGNPITHLDLSPDGQLLLYSSLGGSSGIMDVENDMRLSGLNYFVQSASRAVFSSDGSRVACIKEESAFVCDVKKGKVLFQYDRHKSIIQDIAISKKGEIVATVSGDNTIGNKRHSVRIWNLDTGKEIAFFDGYSAAFMCVAMSSDGRYVAAGSADHKIYIWNIIEKNLVSQLEGHKHIVLSVDFSPDNEQLASGSIDKSVHVWDWRKRKSLLWLQGHTDLINSVRFSHAGDRLLSGSADMTTLIWNLRTSVVPRTNRLRGHVKDIVSLANDCKYIVTAGEDNAVYQWDSKGVCIGRLDAKFAPTTDSSFNIYETLSQNNIQIMKLNTREPDRDVVRNVILTIDQRTILIRSDYRLFIVDGKTGKEKLRIEHDKGITFSIISHSGKLIGAGFWDGSICVWDQQGNKLTEVSDSNQKREGCVLYDGADRVMWTQEVTCMAFDEDDRQVAVGFQDGSMRLWSLESKTFTGHWGHRSAVRALAISRRGDYIVSGSEEGSVLLWNVPKQKSVSKYVRLISLRGHKSNVAGIAIGSNDIGIVSVSTDRVVLIDDLTSGKARVFAGKADINELRSADQDCYAFSKQLETSILSAKSCQEIGWIPNSFDIIKRDQNRLVWIGSAGYHLCLYELKGQLRADFENNSCNIDAFKVEDIIATDRHPAKGF